MKIFAELDSGNTGIGLIERIRQGQGRPTRIYVKKFILSVENHVDKPVENSENSNRGSQDFKKAEVQTSRMLSLIRSIRISLMKKRITITILSINQSIHQSMRSLSENHNLKRLI